ncbi:MAG: proton-conducting transporter membrane subunit, partial [Verrucomicrobiota bacterium]
SNAGMFHLYTHAFFKALLFLGSGAVIYACHHEQDIWKMGGLRKQMPITFLTFALGTAALIAVPFTSGFWSKELILETAYKEGAMFPYVCGIIVAFLTPFYMTRLVIVAFFGKNRTDDADHAKEVGPIMWAPLAILAVMAIISGYKPIANALLAQEYAHVGHLFSHFGLTAILSLVGLAVGVAGAIFLYRGKESDPIKIPLFANRFYLDELYIGIVRLFQDAVASVLDIVDRFIIDPLLVRLPALGAMGAGTFLRVFQIGNVQSYAFFFGIAVIALILFLIL